MPDDHFNFQWVCQRGVELVVVGLDVRRSALGTGHNIGVLVDDRPGVGSCFAHVARQVVLAGVKQAIVTGLKPNRVAIQNGVLHCRRTTVNIYAYSTARYRQVGGRHSRTRDRKPAIRRRRRDHHVSRRTTAASQRQILDWHCHRFSIGSRLDVDRAAGQGPIDSLLDSTVAVGIGNRHLLTQGRDVQQGEITGKPPGTIVRINPRTEIRREVDQPACHGIDVRFIAAAPPIRGGIDLVSSRGIFQRLRDIARKVTVVDSGHTVIGDYHAMLVGRQASPRDDHTAFGNHHANTHIAGNFARAYNRCTNINDLHSKDLGVLDQRIGNSGRPAIDDDAVKSAFNLRVNNRQRAITVNARFKGTVNLKTIDCYVRTAVNYLQAGTPKARTINHGVVIRRRDE